MSKARDLADFISTGSILSDGTIESTEISGVTADATEINKLDGLTADTTELNKLDGVTATTAELNKLAGTTATTSDFDKLSNVTASATELNYMTGATSSIQSQLDNISVTSGSLTKSFTNGESATITLAQSITPAPVVSVTKEVAQTGQSSKGAWDVNATASNYDLHNTAYATTLTPNTPYDYSSGTSETQADIDADVGTPTSVAFSDDGLKYFVLDTSSTIYEYALSTAYDVDTQTLTTSFDASTQVTTGFVLRFKPDGTKMYVGNSTTTIYQYSLSTAWDISTASYDSKSFDATTQITATRGLAFNPDGSDMYIGDVSGTTTKVFQYSLSTPWDVSTASYASKTITISTNTVIGGIDISPLGTTLLIGRETYDDIVSFDIATAWDISTLNTSGTIIGSTSLANTNGVGLSVDGSKIAFTGGASGNLARVGAFSFTASTPYLTLGTGSFASTDVGKRIQGNGGDVILTSTAGAYDTTGGSDFTDTSTIASGSWTMHGLKSAGDDDGLTIVGLASSTPYTVQGQNVISETLTLSSSMPNFGFYTGIEFGDSGNKLFITGGDNSNSYVYQYSLSTAYDVSTASYDGAGNVSSLITYTNGSTFNGDGTRVLVCDAGNNYIRTYSLSTAWDVTSGLNNIQNFGLVFQPSGCTFGNNGNYFYVLNEAGALYRYNLATAYDLNSSLGYDGPYGVQGSVVEDIEFNADGTKFFVLNDSADTIDVYSCSTAWHIASGVTHESSLVKDVSAIGTNIRGFDFGGSNNEKIIYATNPVAVTSSLSAQIPTSQYHLAVTNASGQIDSSFWTDINSMTADQSLGDGEAYYAVSTDDRTTWSVAKASDGVRPIVRNNAGTWQYNTASSTTGYSLSNFTYANKSYDASATHPNNVFGLYFKPDGTSIYALDFSDGDVYQHNLSTAYDISTASYSGNSFNATQFTSGIGLAFSYDGTKVYIASGDGGNETVYQYNLTTAWDISTASYASKSFNPTSQVGNTFGLAINDDGSSFYIADNNTASVYQYTLSTPYDISTASYANKSQAMSAGGLPYDIHFTSDGLLLFIADSGGEYLEKHTLTTAWDLSTASFTERVYTYNASQVANISGVTFNSDGTKLYLSTGGSSKTIYQYSTEEVAYTTSTTWTNATTNDEFYALQQALGATSVNRMDKTQLDAVADGSHFTLGNTLDLMIALKQDTASASLPTSDGVTINYDAEALNQGAVLGTDYDFDFPANNKVRITSNAAQNLKIRVV